MSRLRSLDWDAVAGIAAAVVALVLHLLHVVELHVLLAIVLVILALILIRDLRREAREERTAERVAHTEELVQQLRAAIAPADVILVGPTHLRAATERFARRARGEMTWFNVCLSMFAPQSLFDALLRPAIENPRVTGIQFILDDGEQALWAEAVLPKLSTCVGWEKVRAPRWGALHDESVSFILTETDPGGAIEAQVSFWGEPFMARATGRDIPRYVFHVQSHSELIGRLAELGRQYRAGA